MAHLIQWKQGDVAALKNPSPDEVGTVICNPPYGERLGTTPALIALYSVLDNALKMNLVVGMRRFLVVNLRCLIACVCVLIVNLKRKTVR